MENKSQYELFYERLAQKIQENETLCFGMKMSLSSFEIKEFMIQILYDDNFAKTLNHDEYDMIIHDIFKCGDFRNEFQLKEAK